MNKKWTVLLGVVLLITNVGCTDSFSSKDDSMTPQTRDVFAMDTYMSLKAYGNSADTALSLAEERITELEKIFSVTDSDSDIYAINHAGGVSTAVHDETVKLINKGIEIGGKTGGSLDITLYPIVREWGFTVGDYKIPEPEKLAELMKYVDYTKISVSGNTVTIPKNAEIDLGAVAKGYTGDEVMRILSENGVESAIISLGGNVQALGTKPDGSDWKVAVCDPFSPSDNMCTINIADKAVITSGNYERCFTGKDGKLYWHIIDPKDGYPADNGLVSATIIGDSGLDCDALSTAMFVAGTEKAIDHYKQNQEFDMILVTDDAKIYYTQGIADGFINESSMPSEVIRLD